MTQSEAINILGLPLVFSAAEAKSAYRAAARLAHPDKGGSHEAMKRLNKAYRLIQAGLDFGPAPKIDVSGVDFTPYRPKPSLRTVVKWFSDQMYRRLPKGEQKFSWRSKTGYELFRLLRKECTELDDATERRDKDDVITHCANISNYAMAIADNAKRKL